MKTVSHHHTPAGDTVTTASWSHSSRGRRHPRLARRRRASVRPALVVAVALGALSSCAGDDAATGTTSVTAAAEANVGTTSPPADAISAPATTVPDVSTSPAPSIAEPTSTTFVPPAGQLVERPCDVAAVYVAECYWLEVPERRDIADASTIRLWVAVIRHDGPDAAPIPVFELRGGPGLPTSTGWVAGSAVLDGRDSRSIVIVDQRGTGRSEPRLACPEFDAAIPVTAPYAHRLADRRQLAAACRQRLESDGVDLDGYDTVENAADFVDLRRALELDQVVLRGRSYGARVAKEIYRQDPHGVAGLLLDSPAPTAPFFGPANTIALAEHAIDRLAAACAAQPTCAALGPFEENLAAAAARLDQHPHIGGLGVIDGGVAAWGAIFVMRRSDLLQALPGSAAAIAAGDYSSLEPVGAEFAPSADPRDNEALAMGPVVTCADEGTARTDADRTARTAPGLWEDLVLRFTVDTADCDIWDVTPVDGGQLADPHGDVPVLVTSGALDPTTPPAVADEVRRQFPNTTVVTVPAGGHLVSSYDDCLRSITLAFTANPTAPPDTTCTASLPAPFAPAAQ
jgi:pimeloyl-ACP methyl ester carboxylesterase